MTDSPVVDSRGKAVVVGSTVEAEEFSQGPVSSTTHAAVAVTGSDANIAEMMSLMWMTVTKATTVVLENGDDETHVHSKQALVGKVLSPSILHISTIASAL
jgi:hypothetical protein